MAKQPKKQPVEIISIEKADLYLTPDQKKIASMSMSRVGYVIAWHEAILPRVSQRLSSIWDSREAAEHVIFAAYAETIEQIARKEAKEANK